MDDEYRRLLSARHAHIIEHLKNICLALQIIAGLLVIDIVQKIFIP